MPTLSIWIFSVVFGAPLVQRGQQGAVCLHAQALWSDHHNHHRRCYILFCYRRNILWRYFLLLSGKLPMGNRKEQKKNSRRFLAHSHLWKMLYLPTVPDLLGQYHFFTHCPGLCSGITAWGSLRDCVTTAPSYATHVPCNVVRWLNESFWWNAMH